jgi:hypothetical protein
MSYRRNERHGAEWGAGTLRDPYEERSGGRHPGQRPNPVSRRELNEQLFDLYDDGEADEGEEIDRER